MIWIELLEGSSFAEWDAYVEARPEATCYHLRAWKRVAERAYGIQTSFLLARRKGAIAGVQPLFTVRRPMHCHVTSGLFGAYGEVLADDAETRDSLLAAARVVVAREGAGYLQLKGLGDRASPAPDFTRVDTSVTAVLALSGGPESLWKRFDGDMRTRIRKAQKSGLQVSSGPAELRAFYGLLAVHCHRKGTPAYGFRFMRELAAALGERCEIVTLSLDQRPVAGALVIHFNGTTYVPWACSRREEFKLRPNNLLYWEIIQRSCARGMERLDFGRSPRGSTNLQFKQSWGAALVPVPFHIYQPGRGKPLLDSAAGGVDRLVRLWQKLPRRWVDAVGPAVSPWLV